MSRFVTALALLVWIVIGLLPNPRPSPVPDSAPPDRFSAERAMAHVRAIARKPHPPGTAEHARVRDYIRNELSKLGLSPQIQSFGDLENIVARLPGTANTRPVMLAAHYDSVPAGPGAGDDASGVATLLETARTLRAGPALRNDVILLFTDGEERGLLGAGVFMRDHPWRNEPGVVLNFEARGTGGPSYMFETSAGNLWLVRGLQQVVPRAEASSLSYEVYRRMPNDTDLTVFKRGGLAGMNFAFIGHPEFYHSALDDPAHLDLRSVQEDGRYALSLARLFGNEDLRNRRSANAVYFLTWLTPLVVYPVAWVTPIAWILAAAAMAIAFLPGRRIWILVPFAIVAILQLVISTAAPGVSYVFQFPLLAGIVSYALLVSGPRQWRLVGMMICPAAVTLILLPLLRELVVALGLRHAWPIIVCNLLIVLSCISPQLSLMFTRQELPIRTPATNTSTPPSIT